jgi:hypothetical protein
LIFLPGKISIVRRAAEKYLRVMSSSKIIINKSADDFAEWKK